MPQLAEIATSDLDPRLAAHLEPGETVLWQGHPRPNTFFSPAESLVPLGMIVAGVMLFSGALDRVLFVAEGAFSIQRLLPSLALVGAGALFFAVGWRRRGANWVYAITDRRLISVRGDRLARSVEPGDIAEFGVHRDAAYWRYLTPSTSRERKSREARYPGFHGLDDPADMRRTLEDWREGFSRRAEASAADFVAAQGAAPADDVPEGVLRVRHPATGLTIDVPDGWKTVVRLDDDGPLRIFGVTLLKRVIRPGRELGYTDGADWSTLIVRGAQDSGLTLMIRPGPLEQTLDRVLNDPWAKTFKLETLQTTPDLRVGDFRGFSLVRQMPAGAMLMSFGKVEAPVATRHVWLGHGDMHIEIIGMARLDQPDVQRAVDAMIASLSVT